MILILKIFNQQCSNKVVELFALLLLKPTREHRLKVSVNRSRLDLHMKFFSSRVIDHWDDLSPDTVNLSSLKQCESRLAADLGGKIYTIHVCSITTCLLVSCKVGYPFLVGSSVPLADLV